MPDRYQKLLVDNLDLVERLVEFVARRHRLSPVDADEFASIVRFKLVDRDFAILRKFQGRSALSTYLTVAIDRLCLDFCVAKWGKWRPSASARRMGPVALLLEKLIVRDGVTFDEAVGTLQTNHGISETREELHAMFLRLTPRHGAFTAPEARSPARVAVELDEAHVALERTAQALTAATAALAPEDRLILKLRFHDGLTAGRIAQTLGLRPKAVYRRLQRIISDLRTALLDRGIDESDLSVIIGHPALLLDGLLDEPSSE